MKIALLQFCATQDTAMNLARAIDMSRDALERNAKFILLPELFNFRGDTSNKELLAKAAEKIPGPTVDAFIPLAKKYKVSFLLGSIIEKTSGARAYNSSVFIDSSGKIIAKYRKIHLFDARIGDKIIKEEDYFRAGRRLVTVKTGEFALGLSICYDLRFPSLYQGYARQGVEILTAPSCFTRKTGKAHWETLLRARAIENLAYVLAPNQVGIDVRGIQAHGHSMIISPWGEILACASADAQEIIYGDINVEEVRKARSILPGIIT